MRDFVAALRAAGLGSDRRYRAEPYGGRRRDNPWWTDLLRHGRSSRYADFFDVDWETDDPDLRGKVLAPFLGRSYGEALEAGEIRLANHASGDPVIRYFDSEFPDRSERLRAYRRMRVESFDPGESVTGAHNLHTLLERQHYRLAWWGAAGDEINWRRFFDINGLGRPAH